jgi:hypothetical protein
MIDLSEETPAQERVRDLREWENVHNPNFLKDVLDGSIHFYFSPLHETTKFYLGGRNPPILAVIRYFIKIFQLDLKPRAEEESILQKIISEFDPKSVQGNSYLDGWFKNNIPKLLQNSMDVEYSFNTLNRFRLTEKLKSISGDTGIGSIRWWLEKQPLFTHPIGQAKAERQTPDPVAALQGPVTTAKDLQITEVAHETTSFLVYESITRSHKGLPNVFISRQGILGEMAAFGNGFYVKVGHRSGFRGTGFTIRFRMHPEAVLGVDFEYIKEHQYVVVRNRTVLTIIPENMQLDLLGYYSILTSAEGFSKDDEGVLHRLKLALRSQFAHPSMEDLLALNRFSKAQLINVLERDISLESNILLLPILLTKNPTPGEIVSIMRKMQFKKKSWEREYGERFELLWSQRPAEQIENLFLKSQPSAAEVRDAYQIELVPQDPLWYIEFILPKLLTREDMIEFAQFWGLALAKKAKPSKKMRKYMIEIGRKFYEMEPNETDVASFHFFLGESALSLGLASQSMKDPLIFATAVGKSLQMKEGPGVLTTIPFEHKAVKRIWSHQKENVLKQSLTLQELMTMVDLMVLPEIHLDFAHYALDHHLFKRRSDMIKFVAKLDDFKSLEQTPRGGDVVKLRRRFMEAFFDFKSISKIELYQFLGHARFLDFDAKQKVYFHPLFKMKSIEDLMDLEKNTSSIQRFNELLGENPHWLRQIGELDRAQLIQLFQKLNFGSASIVVLKLYLQLFESDVVNVLEKFTSALYTGAINDPNPNRFKEVEEFWIYAFKKFVQEQRPSPSSLLLLLRNIGTKESYQVFLAALFDQMQTTDELRLLEKLNPSRTEMNLSIGMFMSNSEIKTMNEEVLLPRLQKWLRERELLDQETGQLTPEVFIAVDDLLETNTARLKWLKTFIGLGRKNSNFLPVFRRDTFQDPAIFNLSRARYLTSDEKTKSDQLQKMFYLVHLDLLVDQFQRFSFPFYSGIASLILTTSAPELSSVSDPLTNEQKKFLEGIYRYLLLLGIRNGFTWPHEALSSVSAEEAIRGTFGMNPIPGSAGPLSEFVTPILEDTLSRYHDYLESPTLKNIKDSTIESQKAWAKYRGQYQVQLEGEIRIEREKLDRVIASHPEWRQLFRDLDNDVTQNKSKEPDSRALLCRDAL